MNPVLCVDASPYIQLSNANSEENVYLPVGLHVYPRDSHGNPKMSVCVYMRVHVYMYKYKSSQSTCDFPMFSHIQYKTADG